MHGLFGSSDNWLSLGKVFAQKYRVIMVDMCNHGNSPHSETWNYEAMAQDIYALSQKLALGKFALIGHSMGGKTAIKVVDKYPEIVSRLIVVDIALKAYPIRHQHIVDGLLSIDLEDLSSRKEADEQLAKYVPQLGVRQFLLKNLSRNDQGKFVWKLNLPSIRDHLENVGEATYPIDKVALPSLFIRGADSDYVLESDVKEIDQNFANYALETIDNAGHWVHAEQPKAFMEVAMQFLTQ